MQQQQIKNDVVKVLHSLGSQRYVHLQVDVIDRDGTGGHSVLSIADRIDHNVLQVPLETDSQPILNGYLLAYSQEFKRAGVMVLSDDERQKLHPPPKLLYQIKLDQNFCADEKGNVLLVHNEEYYFNAWIRLSGNIRLEITFRHDNYPALTTQTVLVTDEDLWKHLVKVFDDAWSVRKLNLGQHTITELQETWRQKLE